MRALVWHGKGDIRCDTVTDPRVQDPRDAIIEVTSTAICGSDLHLYDNVLPGMVPGDVIGHEFMGRVVEVGTGHDDLQVGDRVVVPFTIFCGACAQCRREHFSLCQRTNRNSELAEKAFGHATAGMFGYTHLTGGYPGGQAEYVRVPFADRTHIRVPDTLSDEQALFLSDVLPTGWQAVVQSEIQPSDTVAIWGAGPVGQFCVRSAVLLGARQVICIDRLPDRLSMARAGGAITIDFDEEGVVERLDELTDGEGPDKCIDAVGMEAHVGPAHPDSVLDRVKQAAQLSDRGHVLREMIRVCRPGGVLSVPGVYAGMVDHLPIGMLMNKGLTVRTGQTHVTRWTDDLIELIERGDLDPSFVVTHTATLEDGPRLYQTFRDKQDGCVKVVLKP